MKRLLVILALGTTAYGAHRWLADDPAPTATGARHLALDRLWIDHVPTHERDVVQVFAALTSESLGVFQQVSQWRGAHELFKFEAHGDQLRLAYPHTREREQVTVRARACDERGFDYCLEVTGASRGVKRYYSLEGWDLDGLTDARALAARAEALVAAQRR